MPLPDLPVKKAAAMIVIGIILLLLGFLTGIAILWTLGIIVLVIGLILLVLSFSGGGAGGAWYHRRYY